MSTNIIPMEMVAWDAVPPVAPSSRGGPASMSSGLTPHSDILSRVTSLVRALPLISMDGSGRRGTAGRPGGPRTGS
jgi:hypothetical protein